MAIMSEWEASDGDYEDEGVQGGSNLGDSDDESTEAAGNLNFQNNRRREVDEDEDDEDFYRVAGHHDDVEEEGGDLDVTPDATTTLTGSEQGPRKRARIPKTAEQLEKQKRRREETYEKAIDGANSPEEAKFYRFIQERAPFTVTEIKGMAARLRKVSS